jgi:hypothetical protein
MRNPPEDPKEKGVFGPLPQSIYRCTSPKMALEAPGKYGATCKSTEQTRKRK